MTWQLSCILSYVLRFTCQSPQCEAWDFAGPFIAKVFPFKLVKKQLSKWKGAWEVSACLEHGSRVSDR